MRKANKILSAILVLQICFFSLVWMKSGRHASVKPRTLFSALKLDDVRKVVITDQEKQRSELLKGNGQWTLTSGGGYPVEESKVKAFFGRLPGLKATLPVATKSTHHRALEVAEEKFQRKVELTGADGKAVIFYLGSSPGFKSVHFRFGDETDVFQVNGLTAWDVGAPASNWINTDYFKFDPKQTVAFTVTNPNGAMSFSKGIDGGWTMSEPKSDRPIKASSIDSFLSSVSAIPMQLPVAKADNAEFGLGAPAGILTVTVEKKNEKKTATPGMPERLRAEAIAKVKGGGGGAAVAAAAAADKAAGAGEQVERTVYRMVIGAKKDDDYFAKQDPGEWIVRVAAWSADAILTKKGDDFLEKEDATKTSDNGHLKKTTAVKGS